MKNPVLHIKKGVERYIDPPPGSEEELPRQGPLGTRPPKRSSARVPRRRGRYAYLPLLILALALAFVFRVLPRPATNRAALMGWDVLLRAVPYRGAGSVGGDPEPVLLVSVTFIEKAQPGAELRSSQALPAVVRFLLPDTGEQLSVSGDLVKSPITLHGQMPYTDRVRKVLATVSVGAETRTLSMAAGKAP
jgi:hypothetical protein